MSTASSILDKSLRRHVSPVLREAGFDKVDARNGRRWLDGIVWVFNIRAIGQNNSGWPPDSVCVWLGVYYTFIPMLVRKSGKISVRSDGEGRLLPLEFECHMRSQLESRLDLTPMTEALADRRASMRRSWQSTEVRPARTDIWPVKSGGSNAEEVAKDISRALSAYGLKWFRQCGDLPRILSAVETEPDGFGKFSRASFLAKQVGDLAKWHEYDRLAEVEAIRIGRSVDRTTWWTVWSPILLDFG